MISTYNARVKYPASDEAYDSGHGPSFNVAVEILNGAGEPDTLAPKTKKEGITNIYKKVGEPELPFMQSLQSGDEIQLQYNSQGKGFYDFVIPVGWTAPTQAQQKNVVTSSLKEFSPLTQGEMAALQTLIDEETALTMYGLHKLADHLGDVEFPDGSRVSPDAMLQTASGHRVSALIRHSRGQETVAQFGDVKATLFEDHVDEDNLTVTSLEAIVKFAPTEYDVDMLRQDMNAIGVAQSGFNTIETALVVAETIWEMLEVIEGGMDRDVAVSSAREAYKTV